MKKWKPLRLFLLLFALYTCTGTEASADTQPRQGTEKIFSGVLVGSSGAYRLICGKSGMVAYVKWEGVEYKLTKNRPFKKGDIFTLTNGKVSLTFSADETGPQIAFNIPGHIVYSTIVEEGEDQSDPFTGHYTGVGHLWVFNGNDQWTLVSQEIYNLSLTKERFISISKNHNCVGCEQPSHPKIYRKEGRVLQKSPNEILLKTLRENDGNKTTLRNLSAEAQEESLRSFGIYGQELKYQSIYTEIQAGIPVTYKYEISLKKAF